MTEQQRPIHVSERVRELVSGELPEEERRRRGLLLPELRLRADTPAVEVDSATPVTEALSGLGAETDTLAIREQHGEPQAIVLSVERYLELAGKEIHSAPKIGTLDGRIMPQEATFSRAHVEQVNPNENWFGQAPKTL
jgi:hypothetical protein